MYVFHFFSFTCTLLMKDYTATLQLAPTASAAAEDQTTVVPMPVSWARSSSSAALKFISTSVSAPTTTIVAPVVSATPTAVAAPSDTSTAKNNAGLSRRIPRIGREGLIWVLSGLLFAWLS